MATYRYDDFDGDLSGWSGETGKFFTENSKLKTGQQVHDYDATIRIVDWDSGTVTGVIANPYFNTISNGYSNFSGTIEFNFRNDINDEQFLSVRYDAADDEWASTYGDGSGGGTYYIHKTESNPASATIEMYVDPDANTISAYVDGNGYSGKPPAYGHQVDSDGVHEFNINVRTTSTGAEIEAEVGYVDYTKPSAPLSPDNVNLTYNSDDQLTLSWDHDTSGDDADSFDVQMSRDGSAYSYPEGGSKNISYDGSTSYSVTYGPASDQPYDEQVGIDSEFTFRVRATNDVGSSSWSYSDTEYTTPIKPHDPVASRPDSTTVDVSYTVQADHATTTTVFYREDTGGGYGSWTYSGQTDEHGRGATGTRRTQTFSVSGTSWMQEDARYQFKLRHENKDAPSRLDSSFAYADYGNEGNLFFADDFESNDLSAWDSVEQDAFTDSGSGADGGFSGADEGTYYCRLDASGRIEKNLGDLSGETDVVVKCALAAGSMDNSTEQAELEWYDGSSWSNLTGLNWEYNRQGWVEVTALVPDSALSTDNRVAFDQEGGGGDYTYVDRVVVSDLLHEFTKPAAPSGLSADVGTVGELTLNHTLNATFPTGHNAEIRPTGGSWSQQSTSGSSTTFTGLTDGEEYEAKVYSFVQQFRNGSSESYYNSADPSEIATTRLPAPTALSVSNVTDDAADLSWADNANGEAGYSAVISRNELGSESFEDGVGDWTINDLTQVTDRVREGSYAGYTAGNLGASPHAYRDFWPGGEQIDWFSFWWQETSNSTGGGVRLFNSNGNDEVGITTDNPEYDVDDATQTGQVIDPRGYNGYVSYDAWVQTTLAFDWSNNTVKIGWFQPTSYRHYRDTFDLKHGVNIERVELWNYNGGTWGDNSHEMWWDEIRGGHSADVGADTTTVTATGLLDGEEYEAVVFAETPHAVIEDS